MAVFVLEFEDKAVDDGGGQGGEDEIEGHGQQHDCGGGVELGVAVLGHLLTRGGASQSGMDR